MIGTLDIESKIGIVIQNIVFVGSIIVLGKIEIISSINSQQTVIYIHSQRLGGGRGERGGVGGGLDWGGGQSLTTN